MKPKKAPHIRKRIEIKSCVCVSDTHCGCRLALMGRDPIPLDDGGTYSPSKYQIILADRWEEFWDRFVPEWIPNGEPFCCVLNGDGVEGVHHGTTSTISNNLSDQSKIAARLLRPIVERCEGRFYWIRGTEAHVGKQAMDEERIARLIQAKPNRDGQHARWDLWLRLGDSLVHFLHHIGTTGSSAYETTAICRELVGEFNEAAR